MLYSLIFNATQRQILTNLRKKALENKSGKLSQNTPVLPQVVTIREIS